MYEVTYKKRPPFCSHYQVHLYQNPKYLKIVIFVFTEANELKRWLEHYKSLDLKSRIRIQYVNPIINSGPIEEFDMPPRPEDLAEEAECRQDSKQNR